MVLLAQEQVIRKGTFISNPANRPVEEVYKQCFFEYFDGLYHYAFTIVKNNAEAKDIVQTAFVKLWEKRTDVNLSGAARSYLYTSVYHLCLNNIRDLKSRERHHKSFSTEDANYRNPAEDKETRLRIQQAIDLLPPKCREVFNKSRFEGKKYSLIAIEMNISVKTVEAQMGKALRYLREQLADLALIGLIHLFT